MLRVIGLALIFVVGVATPAEAGGPETGVAVASAARSGLSPDHEALPGVWAQAGANRPMAVAAAARLSLRTGDRGAREQAVDGPAGLGSLAPEREPGLGLPWRSQGRSTFALALTDRLAVGLGYRHVQGEDLWQEFADIGSTDYESHNVLLRAHWRF